MNSTKDAIFKNELPTNMPAWAYFKRLPCELISCDSIEISQYIIKDCFNPVIDPFTGITITSSIKQFTNFCDNNGIEYHEDYDRYCFHVRLIASI